MTSKLTDNHGRTIDYLRLAVTDRCNLRCSYCMPEEGLLHLQKELILSWEEMERICRIFVNLGVNKIRITGGEPFVRKGLTDFLAGLKQILPTPQIAITTNGTLLDPHLRYLKELGIHDLNISLDSLNPDTFRLITRRDGFGKILSTIDAAIDMEFRVKVNMVVLPGINTKDLASFGEFTRERAVTVRFIEPMPFNGQSLITDKKITGDEILSQLMRQYELKPVNSVNPGVAREYHVQGFLGKIGIINGASRTFCDSCSRIRVSAQGQMRTCLYGVNVLDLRDLLRSGADDSEISDTVRETLQYRFKDGFEAEDHRKKVQFESMAAIGG